MGKSRKRIRRNRRKRKKQKPKKGFDSITRIACKVRDGYKCQMPGCDATTNLQAHHIIKRQVCLDEYGWSKYKTNNIKNSVTLCRRHHELLHNNNIWGDYIRYFQTIICNSTCN